MRLTLTALEPRDCPGLLTTAGPLVSYRGWTADPYGPIGAEASTGADRNGDGVPEVYCVPQVNGGAVVTVLDGATGGQQAAIQAFDADVRWGFRVTANSRQVAVAIGEGGGPAYEVYDAFTLQKVSAGWAGDPNTRRGATVHLDDLDVLDAAATPVVAAAAAGWPEALASKGIGYYGTRPPQAWLDAAIPVLGTLSGRFWSDFRSWGGAVDLVTGIAPTAHPAMAAFAGQVNLPTGEANDQAAGLTDQARGFSVLATDRIGVRGLVHEIMHQFDYGVGVRESANPLSSLPAFRAVYAAVRPAGRETSVLEYFAEGATRYVLGEAQPAAERTYFAALFSSHGW